MANVTAAEVTRTTWQTFFDTINECKLGEISLSSLLSAILTLFLCLVAIRIISGILGRALGRSRRIDATLRGFVSSTVRAALWAITLIMTAKALGIDTSSLVAMLSVIGLALSLSAQNVLSNLFSGLTLLLTKPFVAGEYIEVAGKQGLVKTVGLFYTQLDTLDNVVISIPNSDVTGSSVTNYSREPLRRVDQYFCASYDDDTDKVIAAILEAAREDERVLADPAPFVRLYAYESSCIKYISRIWCRGSDYWNVFYGMNERVRESFKRNGVTMSYEHVNVHIVEQ